MHSKNKNNIIHPNNKIIIIMLVSYKNRIKLKYNFLS